MLIMKIYKHLSQIQENITNYAYMEQIVIPW